jgi:CheY-like chemotaxis protein
VGNGREALRAVQEKAYDLVAMDCQMPEMDGYAATMAIRDLGGAYTRLPIFAMTANAMQGDAEKCLAAGMNDYLSKPVKAERLLALLSKYFKATRAA